MQFWLYMAIVLVLAIEAMGGKIQCTAGPTVLWHPVQIQFFMQSLPLLAYNLHAMYMLL